MLETLLIILAWDLPAPSILLEEDGCICLDWDDGHSISITKDGKVSWAALTQDKPWHLHEIAVGKSHGTDLENFKSIMLERARK